MFSHSPCNFGTKSKQIAVIGYHCYLLWGCMRDNKRKIFCGIAILPRRGWNIGRTHLKKSNIQLSKVCASWSVPSPTIIFHKGNKSVDEMWGKMEYLSNRWTKMESVFLRQERFWNLLLLEEEKIEFTLFLTV